MFAMVDGIQRRRWLKNSLNPSGAKVKASEAAQYSTLQGMNWLSSLVYIGKSDCMPYNMNVPDYFAMFFKLDLCTMNNSINKVSL